MEVDLSPRQPEPVAEAVAELLVDGGGELDPWWEAGVRESLESLET